MAVADPEPGTTGCRRRPRPAGGGRSFAPRYPGWLTAPSLLYYAIFFLGPMSILAVFSVSIQHGFGGVTYTFSTIQFHRSSPRSTSRLLAHAQMAAGGSMCTILVGYPVCYWMARYLTTYKMLALLLIVVPFWTSFLIRTYALKIILDPNGYLAKDLALQRHLHLEGGRHRPGLQLLAALHPARVRVARADGLDAGRGGTDLGARPLTRSGTSPCG